MATLNSDQTYLTCSVNWLLCWDRVTYQTLAEKVDMPSEDCKASRRVLGSLRTTYRGLWDKSRLMRASRCMYLKLAYTINK